MNYTNKNVKVKELTKGQWYTLNSNLNIMIKLNEGDNVTVKTNQTSFEFPFTQDHLNNIWRNEYNEDFPFNMFHNENSVGYLLELASMTINGCKGESIA